MEDGFGKLREEDNNRRDIMENECFVCGFTRTGYGEEPMVRGPTFDQHKELEHQHWNYVLLFVYLKRKDRTDYTGAESYIWAMIQKQDYSWIPSRASFAIQSYKAKTELDKEKAKALPIDGAIMGAMFAKVAKVAEDVLDIKKELHGVASEVEKNQAM